MSNRAKSKGSGQWDANRVKALRTHLGLTQQQLADELGTRQQTISEWETGMYLPRGTSRTILRLVAERAGFEYQVAPPEEAGDTEVGDTENVRYAQPHGGPGDSARGVSHG